MKEGLESLGYQVIPGEANFLLFRAGTASIGNVRNVAGEDLSCRLRDRGILIRDCSDYEGLSEGWYRVAVRTHEENRILLEALAFSTSV